MQNPRYKKTLKDIYQFAVDNDNEISRFSAADILQMEHPGISEADINRAVQELKDKGIRIKTNADEDYPAENIDPAEFYPANVNISQTNLSVSNVIERLKIQFLTCSLFWTISAFKFRRMKQTLCS